MEKKIITLLAVLLITLPTRSFSASHLNFVPYIGADAQWRHMDFQKGFGQNLISHNYPQGNVYLGVKLNDYLGIEGGYESTTSKTRSATLLGSDTYFGVIFDSAPGFANDINRFVTTTKIHGVHANIVGFLPICDKYRLQLIGSLGIARLKIKLIHDIPITRGEINPTMVEDHRVFAKTKWIPKINVGLQHMINCQFGVRAMAGWEGTKHFGDIKPVNVPSSILIARAKNSLNFGLGFFYNFK